MREPVYVEKHIIWKSSLKRSLGSDPKDRLMNSISPPLPNPPERCFPGLYQSHCKSVGGQAGGGGGGGRGWGGGRGVLTSKNHVKRGPDFWGLKKVVCPPKPPFFRVGLLGSGNNVRAGVCAGV